MPLQTKLMLMCMLLLAAGLVYAVLRVTAAWHEHHVARHDLIAESKRRRFNYLKALADRDRELIEQEEGLPDQSVIVEDDAEADDPVYAQAA